MLARGNLWARMRLRGAYRENIHKIAPPPRLRPMCKARFLRNGHDSETELHVVGHLSTRFLFRTPLFVGLALFMLWDSEL